MERVAILKLARGTKRLFDKILLSPERGSNPGPPGDKPVSYPLSQGAAYLTMQNLDFINTIRIVSKMMTPRARSARAYFL